MNYYRPAPHELEGNYYLDMLTLDLKEEGFYATNFKYWKLLELYNNRNKCNIIHMHWPESFWRSDNLLVVFLKAIWFFIIFVFSKFFGYKWVFSAHNVIPHYKVKFPYLEKVMRQFILNYFDLVIGLAYNTKNDLEKAFGTSGKKYILALHGTYEDLYPVVKSKYDMRSDWDITSKSKIILSINTLDRKNKGTDDLLSAWNSIRNYGNVHLLLTGVKPDNYDKLIKNPNFHFIEGRISDADMGDFLNAVDFMFLNYKSITTSGMYFLAVTLNLPVIAPDLSFFKLHTSDKTALLFSSKSPLIYQLNNIIEKINNDWEYDKYPFEVLKKEYSSSNSAKIIAKEFYKLNSS
jgi:beta-1,4-mannosyltransferase